MVKPPRERKMNKHSFSTLSLAAAARRFSMDVESPPGRGAAMRLPSFCASGRSSTYCAGIRSPSFSAGMGSRSSFGSTNDSSPNCLTPDSAALLRHEVFNPNRERKRLMSVPATLTIAQRAKQENIPDFVIPTRRVDPDKPRATATSELLAYLDKKEVRDYNVVIKKEMSGEDVASSKRKIVYENVQVFELNKSFPRYEGSLEDIDDIEDTEDEDEDEEL